MIKTLTLIADLAEAPFGSRHTIRTMNRSDIDALGALYFDAYDPGAACETLDEAAADIEASFEGAYGTLLTDASLVALIDNEIVAALMVVERAPWPDTPPCPFIIEMFTDRAHRRLRIALELVEKCQHELAQAGYRQVALRVAADNIPALRLYDAAGFAEWEPEP